MSRHLERIHSTGRPEVYRGATYTMPARRPVYTNQAFPRPRWVMCGVDIPGERPCRLIASNTLRLAELTAEYEYADLVDPSHIMYQAIMTHATLTLTTVMRNMVIIDGPDWRTCFEELFRKWSPSGAIGEIEP